MIGVPIDLILSGNLVNAIAKQVSHFSTVNVLQTKITVMIMKMTVVLVHFLIPNKEDVYHVQMAV